MIRIDAETRKLIEQIVFRYLDPKKTKVFVFGSRALGTARRFSDVDIGLESAKKVPIDKMIMIEQAFEESDLPYSVDVVDFRTVSRRFEEVAKKSALYLN